MLTRETLQHPCCKNYTFTMLTEMLTEVFPVDSTTTPVCLSSCRTNRLSTWRWWEHQARCSVNQRVGETLQHPCCKNYTLTVLTEMLTEVFPLDSKTTPVGLSSCRRNRLSTWRWWEHLARCSVNQRVGETLQHPCCKNYTLTVLTEVFPVDSSYAPKMQVTTSESNHRGDA